MRRIEIRRLFRSLEPRRVGPEHFEAAAALCRGNPLYYEHYGAPPPEPAEISEDLEALPPARRMRTNTTSAASTAGSSGSCWTS